MDPVEEMIQAYVAMADGVISKEEYHARYMAFSEHTTGNSCHRCGSRNLGALFEDARFREAVLKHKGEELGQVLIKSGLNCGKATYAECICGKSSE